MAATEVAVSLAVVRLRDLLSNSKDIVIYRKLTDQISDSISDLQRIMNTRKHAELDDDHHQETSDKQLLLSARRAEKIAGEILSQLLQDRMSKSQKRSFAKVFALLGFFSVVNRVRARKKMHLMTMVGSLSSMFASFRPPAEEGLPDNERASPSSSSRRIRENMRQRVESDIVDREDYVQMLLAGLLDGKDDGNSNLRVISVLGEPASGKTALVRSVFSRLEIKHHFDCRAWVHVTGHGLEPDRMENLLVDILKQTPLRDQAKDLELRQEEQLIDMLHKSLMDLRYLLVVDNLAKASLMNKLLVPFVDSMNGSRVIVTTTDEKMQRFADPWTPGLQLRPALTERECKELLLASITGGGNSVDNLESKMTILEERILRKCNGPPPAISLLGGLLSAAEVSNWEALINRAADHPTLDNIMCLSFDKLPHMMKPCVLHMALFPQESEVPTRRLFRQWTAEGLLAEAADGSVQMPSAEDCFHELESRNLIRAVRRRPDGSARSCRMAAFLHKFFFQKAKESGLLQVQYSSHSVSEKNAEQNAQNQQKQAQNTATGHSGYKVQCLQSFASFNTRKLGTHVRENEVLKSPILDGCLVLLRVLDLEGVYKPVLPETFGSTLSNLRYLGLRWTVLDSIPESVGNLLLLETLDLKHTNITKVTSAIWNAKNLQHLYLSEASFDKSIKQQISSGKSPNTKLQTLWGLFIETAKSPMISVLGKLENLLKLAVTCRPGAVEKVTAEVSKLARLESLRLRSRDLFGQPASLHLSNMTGLEHLSNMYLLGSLQPVEDLSLVLPRNLKALTLSMSELEGNPLQVQCLKDLIVLRLFARSCTHTELYCDADFPKLRILKLWMLEKLKKFDIKKGTMCHLEELEIRQCKKLQMVDGLVHIHSLNSVSLTGVKEVLRDRLAPGVGVPHHTLVKAKELVLEKDSASTK